MSQGQPPQYPPQYPPPPPPPQQPPPTGYPPSGSYPPPGTGGFPPPGTGGFPPGGVPPTGPKTSVAAVFSLVLGILSCIPGSGLIAIILGIVGIGATKNGQRNGRGMAIAGLLLGLLGTVIWSGIGMASYTIHRKMTETRPVRNQFIQDLVSGKVDSAQSVCTSDVSTEELQAVSDQLKKMGTIQDITGVDVKGNIVGVVTLTRGQKKFILGMEQVNGQWKIKSVQFADPNQNITPNMSKTSNTSSSE